MEEFTGTIVVYEATPTRIPILVTGADYACTDLIRTAHGVQYGIVMVVDCSDNGGKPELEITFETRYPATSGACKFPDAGIFPIDLPADVDASRLADWCRDDIAPKLRAIHSAYLAERDQADDGPWELGDASFELAAWLERDIESKGWAPRLLEGTGLYSACDYYVDDPEACDASSTDEELYASATAEVDTALDEYSIVLEHSDVLEYITSIRDALRDDAKSDE